MSKLFICALLIFATVAAQAQGMSTIEQQIEALRSQLRDVAEKESALQERARQLDEDLQPENVERSVASIGTTDARALRDQRRQQLEREKSNLQSQLQSLAASRTRLEASIAAAEAEAVRLRANALNANNAAPPTDAPVATTPAVEVKSVTPGKKKPRAGKRTRRVRARRRAAAR